MVIVDESGPRTIEARRAARGRHGRWARPLAEVLEGRQLLATITVTTTGDADGADGNDTLSLRQAIEIANGTLPIASLTPTQQALVSGAASTPETIDFAIPGAGPFVIAPATPLPAITVPVVVDGYSQPGASPSTGGPGMADNAVIRVEIDGVNLHDYPGSIVLFSYPGLVLSGGDSTVQGLAFVDFVASFTIPAGHEDFTTFMGTGIILQDKGDDVVRGNFLGLDTTGSLGTGPTGYGVQDFNAPGAGDTIGGTAPADRNVISGARFGVSSDGGALVEGNFIGTDPTGTRTPAGTLTYAFPNSGAGVLSSAGDTIGGTIAGAGNVISGNGMGISSTSGTGGLGLVEGNLIGTDITGTRPLGNFAGIMFESSEAATVPTIGGTTAGARNVISGNTQYGIQVEFTSRVVVEGNFIGTDVTGAQAIPNGAGVSVVGQNVTIGGTAAGSGNVISGNTGAGLSLSETDNLAEGNLIGTDATGTKAVPNGLGVVINVGGGIMGQASTVGGTTPAARNVISGNAGPGLWIFDNTGADFVRNDSGPGSLVQGNFIGTDATGTRAVPNQSGGLLISGGTTPNTIGGTAPGAGNVISGNVGDGVDLGASLGSISPIPTHDLFEGNLIGTDATGAVPLPNTGQGVAIGAGTSNTIGGTAAGAGNIIAFNGGAGVGIAPFTSLTGSVAIPAGQTISDNSIYGNAGLGIDLGDDGVTPNNPAGSPTGPNLLQPYPTLAFAVPAAHGSAIAGTLDALPSTAYTLEFFANPVADPSGFGQGQTYLGSTVVTTDASGHATITFETPESPLGQFVSATATDPMGNTSEFSRAVILAAPPPPVIPTMPPAPPTVVATTTTLIGQGTASVFGRPVTFAAVVARPTSGGPVPTGMVVFAQGGVILGEAPLNAQGVAVFITNGLPFGNVVVEALYLGDSSNAMSLSNFVAQAVQPVAALTTLIGPKSPGRTGQTATFAAIVSPTVLDNTPTGSVIFGEGGVLLGEAPLNGSGVAVLITDRLSLGANVIEAAYLGDPSNAPSLSNFVSVSVRPAGSGKSAVKARAIRASAVPAHPSGPKHPSHARKAH